MSSNSATKLPNARPQTADERVTARRAAKALVRSREATPHRRGHGRSTGHAR